MLADQLSLLAEKLLGLLACVSALTFLRLQSQLDEGGAEGLHLFFHDWAHVVGGDDRSQPARGGDRLQARDSRAHDQHPRRSHSAGRGHHHREELPQPLRRHQHGLVARSRGLR